MDRKSPKMAVTAPTAAPIHIIILSNNTELGCSIILEPQAMARPKPTAIIITVTLRLAFFLIIFCKLPPILYEQFLRNKTLYQFYQKVKI